MPARKAMAVTGAIMVVVAVLVVLATTDTHPARAVVTKPGWDAIPETTLDTDGDGDYDYISASMLEDCRDDVSVGETTKQIDMFVLGAPDLITYEAYVEYKPLGVIKITGADTKQYIDAQPGSAVTNTSENEPDQDTGVLAFSDPTSLDFDRGYGVYLTGALDTNGTIDGDSDDGVLARFTLEAEAAGSVRFTFQFANRDANPDYEQGIHLLSNYTTWLGDTDSDTWFDGTFLNKTIAVAVGMPGACTTDSDSDTVNDAFDNCPDDYNPDQVDSNGNGIGDVCWLDPDGDTIPSDEDNCPNTPNVDQADWDADGIGDVCDDSDGDGVFDDTDNCRSDPNTNQADQDGDGVGDVCDPDIDGDGVLNGADNCPTVANPEPQADTDSDGLGDPCDGDIDGDGYWNDQETAAESDITNPAKTPEVCDGTDNDGDTLVDEGYDYSRPGGGPPNGVADCNEEVDSDGDGMPNNPVDEDDDNDGFTDVQEIWMRTNTLVWCPGPSGDDNWAPDLDFDNKVDIFDVLGMKPHFGGEWGDPEYSKRHDLDADTDDDIFDILAMKPHFGDSESCA